MLGMLVPSKQGQKGSPGKPVPITEQLGSRANPKLLCSRGAAAHSLEDRCSLAGFTGFCWARLKVQGQ